jgi:membrane-bound lytic murein transglycosylase A
MSLCADVRRLSIADDAQRRQWMESRLQPHRLQAESGASEGLLTAYYEPVFDASRERSPGYEVPLYAPPPELASGSSRTPWFTREEIDTRAEVRARLRPLAWLSDPVDALVLHIQGSGRLRFKEANGSTTEVGIRYAASNNQPYRSVGRALLDARELTDASWPGIQAWFVRNPVRAQSFMWTNPRYVFFKEAPIAEPELGPPGAQGVPLTAMRSIAVDPRSVPYGSLMWLHTRGTDLQLSQLVLAQDTGSAIVGAVRADLFAGTGAKAGALAGRIKQPLWLWVLKPR